MKLSTIIISLSFILSLLFYTLYKINDKDILYAILSIAFLLIAAFSAEYFFNYNYLEEEIVKEGLKEGW